MNRKGYLTVEIILASVITFIIAFFLIEITMKLVGKTDDAYNDTLLYTEKALITKELKEAIEEDIYSNGKINDVNEKDCIFIYNYKGRLIYKMRIATLKDEETGSSVLIYGQYEDNVMEDINYKQEYNDNTNSAIFLNDPIISNNNINVKSNVQLIHAVMGYQRIIKGNLKIGVPQCKSSDNNDYIFIKIPLSNTFSEKNKYDVNIIIDNKEKYR